jgi:hypothetical protein
MAVLPGLLRDGPVRASDIFKAMDASGIRFTQGIRQYVRAKMGIIARQADEGIWYWELPATHPPPVG